MKNVFQKGFFYLVVFAMVLGNSVVSIDFSIPVAHADEENNDKITICHVPPGNPANAQTLQVSADGWDGHQGHELDYEGPCIEQVSLNPYPVPVVAASFNPAPTNVTITWDEITDDRLRGYKVVFSETNPNPAYPDDGYIRFETDSTVTSFDYSDADYYNDYGNHYVCGTDYYFSVTGYYDGGSHLEPGNGVTVNFACEEEPDDYTVKAAKVVCQEETDLPNWGNGSSGPSYITDTTAQDYVDASQGKCWLEENWAFQWGIDVADPGNDFIGQANNGWNNFDTTTGNGTMAEALIPFGDASTLKFREVLPNSDYIPFAWDQADGGDGTADDVSAEIYCYDDILNYDNYDFVRNPQAGETYYCVAFNVNNEPTAECGNGEVEAGEECDDGPNGSASCTSECTIIEEECYLEDNLLVNSSFEEPEVTEASLWQKMSSVLGWVIEKVLDNSPTTLELHKSWSGNTAAQGLQYSELDGDHSTIIKQEANTEIGAKYKLFWSFAGRHNIDAEQNHLAVEVNGNQVATNGPVSGNAPLSQDDWVRSSYEFFADSSNTEVAFADIGPSDSFGTYVDDIRLCKIADPVAQCGDYTTDDGEECDDGPNGSNVCTSECTLVYSPHCGDGEVNQDWEQCEPGEDDACTQECQWEDQNSCSDLVLARISSSQVDNGGDGNMSSDIYLGSDSYVIPSGAWFPLYWQSAPYNLNNPDPDILSYEDVPGLAVQRLADKVRVAMHTTLTKNDFEEISASLEFYNADATGYYSDPADNNKLENSGDHPDVVNVYDNMADFYLWANTGDDGFYTNWSIVEDCDDPEYSSYCGDGIVDDTWEQCDPAAENKIGCTDQCQFMTDQCNDLVAAKINIEDVQRWGNGDMSSDIYLGSDSYVIPQGVWFPLYKDGNYFVDGDIQYYEDVPGLAVQRLEDSLRTVMYGTGSGDDKEHVDGNIEFYNATLGTQIISDENNDNPGNNRLENGDDGTGVNQYNAGNDEVWVDDNKAYYWLTTTTADDGFYTTWDIIEDCDTSICGVKFNDKNQDLQQGSDEENLADWTINLYEKASCEPGDEWADGVESFDQGPNVAEERSHPEQALGVAEDDWTLNYVSLGISGELVLSFDNLIENGDGDDIKVFETSYNNPSCDAYPEYVHAYASQDGVNWTDLGAPKCQDEDPTFDLGSLPWAKYVKLVDQTSNTPDGFDVDGVKALHCLTIDEESLETTTTSDNGYCFEEIDPGYYMVCEEMQSGWVNSTPLCQQVYLEEGDSIGVNFGNYTEENDSYCGDGYVDTSIGETCDGDDPVACTTDDGYAGYERCNMPLLDTAPLQSVEISYCVWTDCIPDEYCGDGIVNGNEQCEPSLGGGCTDNCQLEEVPEPHCGDGVLTGNEECDDGNNTDGDGCSAVCTEEITTTTGGGGGGGGITTFAINNLQSEVSCAGIDISWLTNMSSDTILDYGLESGVYTENINNDTNSTGHNLLLANLLPDTTYYYQVRAINYQDKEIKTAEKSFTTLPAEQCGAVLGEKIEAPLVCNFLRASGSSGPDADIDGIFQFPNGSLLRDACDPGEPVYLIKDQMKWHVPSWKYLHDYHFGQRIYNVMPNILDFYPDWQAQILGVKDYADGTLLRGPDKKIYILEEGHKRHISTFKELLKYIGQEIIDVSQEVIDRY